MKKSTSMPPENMRKPRGYFFRGYRSETLVENGLSITEIMQIEELNQQQIKQLLPGRRIIRKSMIYLGIEELFADRIIISRLWGQLQAEESSVVYI